MTSTKRLALACIWLVVAATGALAQIQPGGVAIGSTFIQNGTNGQCLYVNGTVLGQQACGGGTAVDIKVGTTTVTGTVSSGDILTDNAGVLGRLTPGTGVSTALGVNVGTAGAFVVNGGALGIPSSGTLTSATGLPISTGLTGAGTGVLTALGVNVGSAGAFVTFNGAGGTPSSMVGTNITGTAAGLTAGNVTTNANLTGVITSVGNATSIASQTGTGSTFVVAASPSITGVVSLGTGPAIVTSPAAASLQHGAADAAVAVAQITRVQSVVAGTAAANGANWTLIGSLPTGTGTSGDIIFQTGVKTGSGTTQGTATTALTIKGETQGVVLAGSLTMGGNAIVSVGNITSSGGLTLSTSGFVSWSTTRSQLGSGADGSLVLVPAAGAGTGAVLFQFGNTTSAAPALKRAASSATLAVRLADDSADAAVTTAAITASGITSITNSTDASASSGSGSFQVAGGASVAKRFWIPALTTSSGLQTAVLCQSSGGEMIADSVACLASGAQFKTILGPMEDGALGKLMKLPLYRWHYNPEGNFTSREWVRERVGPMAQDVAAMDTRLAGYDNQGNIRTYSPDQALALVMKAVQELNAKVDSRQ